MSNLTGTDKSVILLMTIGEDRAAEVFKHLSQREVQTLSAAMANVTQISNKQLTDVLAEFEQEAEQFAALNINANDYLRSVLVKALGEERAASLLEDILETRDTASGIETLNFMEPQSAADLIRDEHPQIIATILVHLKRAQAADILALFDERLRHDVMLRIATSLLRESESSFTKTLFLSARARNSMFSVNREIFSSSSMLPAIVF